MTEKYEIEIKSYKRRLNELDFFKTRVDVSILKSLPICRFTFCVLVVCKICFTFLHQNVKFYSRCPLSSISNWYHFKLVDWCHMVTIWEHFLVYLNILKLKMLMQKPCQQNEIMATCWWNFMKIWYTSGVNSWRPRDAIWWCSSGSTLAQVMVCCLTAPSHYLNQCWLIISEVLWHSPQNKFIGIAQDIFIKWNWKLHF